jgi:hypothetical protein
MTLPIERLYALTNTRNFLRDLLDRSKTPGIPSKFRKEAYWCLKHYPSDFDIERVLEGDRSVLGAPKKERDKWIDKSKEQ